MIEKHISIDTDEFGKTLKQSLLNLPETETFKSIAEIGDIKSLSPKLVHATVVAVFVDKTNLRSEAEFSILMQALADVFSENTRCKDIQTLGCRVVGIFDTPYKQDVDSALESVGKINSLFNLVNKLRGQRNEHNINKGIGMAYGQLHLTACPLVDEIVINWSGEPLETSLKYAEDAMSVSTRVYVAYSIYNNLKEEYQKLFNEGSEGKYVSNPINIAFDHWIESNI